MPLPVGQDPEHPDGASDIRDLMLADIFQSDWQAVAHLVAHRPADVDSARFGQTLQARGDRNTVPVDDVAVRDHIAKIDPDAQTDLSIGCYRRGMCAYSLLDFDRASHGSNDAAKLDKQPVAHRSHNATLMTLDPRVDQFAANPAERRQRAFLVDAHQARIADDIGAHHDSKSVVYPRLAIHSARRFFGGDYLRDISRQPSPEERRVKPA
ncbi:MAG TPA: hypothetical protein VL985_14945 [Stellaceae bacterium]|nr:hypothetical protein [Stellaceae bacterium]